MSRLLLMMIPSSLLVGLFPPLPYQALKIKKKDVIYLTYFCFSASLFFSFFFLFFFFPLQLYIIYVCCVEHQESLAESRKEKVGCCVVVSRDVPSARRTNGCTCERSATNRSLRSIIARVCWGFLSFFFYFLSCSLVGPLLFCGDSYSDASSHHHHSLCCWVCATRLPLPLLHLCAILSFLLSFLLLSVFFLSSLR
ncbi:none [Leptomonas seymouri]|uniref:None n=1 Tax=Leptomonas seymouri TaxID=5684 RepID=A0A0N1PAB5_LEPSE|nr:none [Leptomonas seymouri]|eukprot:KPI85012.1 none [Leptomonas seymouri]